MAPETLRKEHDTRLESRVDACPARDHPGRVEDQHGIGFADSPGGGVGRMDLEGHLFAAQLPQRGTDGPVARGRDQREWKGAALRVAPEAVQALGRLAVEALRHEMDLSVRSAREL